MSARRSRWVVGAGLAVAVLAALAISPWASSSPDGLERVAADRGFEHTAADHAFADGALADYAVRGFEGAWSTGLAGVIGVATTFGLVMGLGWVLRRRPTIRVPGAAPPRTPDIAR